MDMQVKTTQPASATAPIAFIRDPLWYKDAVIYQLHVKSFYDANNDGIGDFAGLIQKLDYIASLGVNAIWLLPFYPSPRRDDGYDISDYRAIHSDYGDMADVRRFIRAAHKRGLRVITELVINHTSDQHPWFQRARQARPGSKARDFYVWSDTDTKYAGTRIIFLDTEKSNWTWDPVAKAYFWHRFYSHQPDLNFDNPQVLKSVLSVMRYWLDMGVDGLRLDAVPYLIEREGTSNENVAETHAVLKRIRAEIDAHYPDRMLLAEANQWPEDTAPYFGEGDECHMAFHFPLMPRMYMALAQEDRFPLTDILRQTPDICANCQWAIFLRNHDELTLEMVTDKERDYLWEKYATDRRARLNLGIRRRLAPLVQRDRRRIELLNSLLLSMPGTPVIYYGDELGMGDNIFLGDRDGVRTPMQWSLDRNGGFSQADPASLVLPPIMDALYGYQSINVEAQARDGHSLLNWTRRMLNVRRQHHAFGRGTMRLLYPANRRIFAYLREFRPEGGAPEVILCAANLAASAQAVELDLSRFAGCVPVEMLGGSAFPPIGQLPYLLTLPPYGFYWFSLASESRMPSWHTKPPEPLPDYRTFVLRKDISEILEGASRRMLEQEVLPTYLPTRRWFAAKDRKLEAVTVAHTMMLPGAARPILLMEFEARSGGGAGPRHEAQRYFLPLGFLPEEETVTALPHQLALARVRRGPRLGYLTDAFSLDALARGFVELLRKGRSLPAGDGELRFEPTSRLAAVEIPADAEIRRLTAEQSNSSLVIGNKAILKVIRRLTEGVHPEAEMGRVLTERGFTHIAPMLGEVARVASDGSRHVLAVLQGYMDTQGDGWAWTLNLLERALRDATGIETAAETTTAAAAGDALRECENFAGRLGTRLGEMHRVLAQDSDDPAFAPQRATVAACHLWADTVNTRLDEAVVELKREELWKSDQEQDQAQRLLKAAPALRKAIEALAARGEGGLLSRIHGDLHLGQVLVVQGDAYFIDFEGEPLLPLAERRRKTSPLRDVAGVLRSYEYAAGVALMQAPDGSGATARQNMADMLRRNCQRNFIEAYNAAAPGLAHGERAAASALLELFTLEKALYELRYEAANRPHWVGFALAGAARAAAAVLPA